jgi:hypothetical protein
LPLQKRDLRHAQLARAIIADAETLRWCEIAVAETESYKL